VPDRFQETSRIVSGTLLQRIATGDGAAVQECIDRYGGLVWSLARQYTAGGSGGQAETEDAVQDIFISIWQNADRFDEAIAAEATFIAMIARRRLIDRRRKQARRRDAANMSENMPEPVAAREERLEMNDDALRAAQALERLRPEQKQVLELSLMHGRTYEQIAESTRLPIGTVKTHARRGLQRLREVLGAAGSGASMEVVS
jgi:RNA polymerase sigma factor (sigma-70 family)